MKQPMTFEIGVSAFTKTKLVVSLAQHHGVITIPFRKHIS